MSVDIRRGLRAREVTSQSETPASGKRLLYPKSDGWYEKDSSGVETKVGPSAGAGGTPTAMAPIVSKLSSDDNSTYTDNTHYWFTALDTNGFPESGIVVGSRNGIYHQQYLQPLLGDYHYQRYYNSNAWTTWGLVQAVTDYLGVTGDLLVGVGTGAGRLPVGANYQTLRANVNEPSGAYSIEWADNGVYPIDHGFKNWTYDPALTSGAAVLPTAGTIYGSKIFNRGAGVPITSVSVYVGTAGASLTNVGFALYNPTTLGLITSSVNTRGATATAFQSTGLKTITFSAVQSITGPFYVCFWVTGTTMPALSRQSFAGANAGLATPNLRFLSANTALTTTAPATLGTQTSPANAYWIACS